MSLGGSMGLSRYLRDRWVTILMMVLALALTALLLHVFALDTAVITFMVLLLLAAVVLALVYEYLRRRHFYTDFTSVCESLDRKHLITEVLDRPTFLEGEIAYDALQGAAKTMNDEIAACQRASQDYRDYIETWVHEIKTPIAAAELAASNGRTGTTEKIAIDLSRIEGYVDQALYYARSTTLERDYLIREIDLGELVRSSVRGHARVLIDAGVQPVFEDIAFPVFADAKWCSFVLGQVIDNAAKYRKPGDSGVPETGHLTFSAEVRDAGMVGERTVLQVADDGIGMPLEDVARAFDRAFTGANGRSYARSTGMGLYLCKRLCDKMGLSLSLDSAEGVGTTVELGFPANRLYLP